MSAEARRALLLQSARQVFLRNGRGGTRMKESAEDAGLTGYEHRHIDAEVLAAVILGTHHWLGMLGLFGGDQLPVEIVAKQVTDLISHGISPSRLATPSDEG